MKSGAQIAVVGISCRLPQAPDPEALWRLLASGQEAIAERALAGGQGAGVDHRYRFDPAFFGLSSEEAATMDPREELALELGWEALESAAVVPGAIDGRPVGAFLNANADRFSRVLGLSGPSLTMEASPPASLIAVHLACQSLNEGESELALAGGVDAAGQTGGVVALKPLAVARDDGDHVHCLVRASAVGGAVDLERPEDQCFELRSAGEPIADLIKVALAIERRELPPSLDVERANPEVAVGGSGGWPGPEQTLVASVSSRGDGEMSCHVVLAEAPVNSTTGKNLTKKNKADEEAKGASAGPTLPGLVPLLLSARSDAALRAQAERLAFHLEANPDLDPADVGFSLATTRPSFQRRAVCVGSDRRQLLDRLGALAEGRGGRGVLSGASKGTRPPVFLFPGQGGQWPGMGRDLLDSSPAFARHLDACEQALEPFVDWSLVDVVREEGGAWLDRLDILQPTLLMVSIALAQLWRDCGVEPSLVIGHSQGEIAAAHIAGGLSLDDAARVVALHSRASVPLIGRGGMATVALPAAEARSRLEPFGERASLAAINGPASVVVSAEPDALGELLDGLAAEGVSAQRIAVDYAAHSPQIETLRAELLEAFAPISPRSGEIPFHSTLTGELLDTGQLGPEYWYRNLRETVCLEPVVREVLGKGPCALIEIGPHPVLAFGLQETVDAVLGDDAEVSVLGTLRRDDGGAERFAISLGQALVAGVPVDRHAILAPAARRVKLPTYPFRREPGEPRQGRPSTLSSPETERWVPMPEPSAPALSGSWAVLVGPEQGDDAEVAALIEAMGSRGALIARIELGGSVESASALAERLRAMPDLEGVLSLAGLAGRGGFEGPASGTMGAAGAVLGAVVEAGCSAPVWLVTSGAVSTDASDPLRSPAQALIWELGATFALREPQRWGGLVDLPEALDRQALKRFCGVLAGAGAGREIALRGSGSLARQAPAETPPVESFAARLAALPSAGRRKLCLELVRAELAVALDRDPADRVDAARPFKEMGLDSIGAVELRNRLRAATGLSLPTAVVFEYPKPAALADFLVEQASGQGGEARRAGGAAVADTARDEPIAILGMACRFPGGVSSPEALWELVAEGHDAIGAFPSDRGWDLSRFAGAGSTAEGAGDAMRGGFLDDPGQFDAEFFSVAPREALAMDPQQRLLLEASWEALEAAGFDPLALGPSRTGVFAGVSSQDYTAGLRASERELEGYLLTGSLTSVVSGRVAYALGLEGPAITVDTACSSSLVALHLAAQALRRGECTLALAGGATVLGSPGIFAEFSHQRGLAGDGRCKSFAEAADGVGFSEGVGVVVLERLSEAQRAGHPVLAVIKGSAVNQDGASNGLTAPNGLAQKRVIRQALANAGHAPGEIDAVEAHGTGTTLGDPIEAEALLATYGQERERPLRLGSIKSNIGHTQAAAGVAGVIKTVMAMREGMLPKTLHVDRPSSKVDWEAGEVELLTEAEPWEPNGSPRRAGVSSFGISGTNAHLILEEAPEPAASATGAGCAADSASAGSKSERLRALPGRIPLALSAKSEPALRESASRLAAHLRAKPELDPTDVAFSLATTRTGFERRAVALGETREELLGALDALGQGGPAPGSIAGRAASDAGLAYLFTGQGSQRVGMGGELHESSPAFKEALDRVLAELEPHLDRSLEGLLFAEPGSTEGEPLGRTTYAQPALFALQVALFETLRAAGLAPDLLAGHSIGELSAAHLAGVLSLPDAAKLVSARGRLMGGLAEGGAMVAVQASERDAKEAIAGREAELSIAAINAPEALVLSGARDAVEEVAAGFAGRGRKTKRLSVSHAFHSPLMEPMLAELAELAEGLDYHEPLIPIVSNVSGELLSAEQATDPAYWVAHVREPVRFADAIATLQALGAGACLELGPDPVLTAMAAECLGGEPEDESPVALIPTLREGSSEAGALARALASAHVAGARLDWGALFLGSGAQRVPLPTYPFQRERYWLDSSSASGDAATIGQTAAEHPLLGAVIEDPEDGSLALSGRISLQSHPWLADHAVLGSAIFPGAGFIDLALRAAEQVGAAEVEELALLAPLTLTEGEAVQLRVSVSGPGEMGQEIAIHSRPEGVEEWIRHASGTISPASPGERQLADLGQWPPRRAEQVELDLLYDRLAAGGLDYGPAFRGLTAAWQDGEDLYAEVSLPPGSGEGRGFGIHPALLDSALHTVGFFAAEGRPAQLPFAWGAVALHAAGATELRVKLSRLGEGAFSLALFDAEGAAVAEVGSLALRTLDPGQLRAPGERQEGLLGVRWLEAPVPAGAAEGEVELWHCPPGDPDQDLAQRLRTTTGAALECVQQWLAKDEAPAGSRLAIVTEGAVAALEQESPDPAAAAVWGLLRSAQSEHPDRFLLIDSDGAEASLGALDGALASGEPQLALRQGRALAPRVAPAAERSGSLPAPGEPGTSVPIEPEKTVLITGGTGGLGALVARHLVNEHGARHLLLASRSGKAAEGAKELQAELREHGAKAKIAACDVSDRAELQELLASISKAHPLGAVIHTAGVLDDGTIESLGAEQLERVFAPKADAALHLHELTAGIELSAFVLFSSVAGVVGGAGQANYAAANAFLDALAESRRAAGLPGTSMAWGMWGEEGMAADLGEADLARLRRSGIDSLSNESGLALFDAALGADDALVLTARFDSAALRAQASSGSLPALLGGLVRVPARRRQGATGSLAAKLATLPEADRDPFVLELVRAEIATVLGHGSADAVDAGAAFKELGFDSLAAVELRNRLRKATGLHLPAAIVFNHPTATRLAAFLRQEASGAAAGETGVVRAALATEEPIAIVGMACRYPGGIGSPEELWRLVEAGGDAIAGFPTDRGWDLERLYHPDPDHPDTSYARDGGFLYDAGEFDAEFFGISPRESLAMDPQQRLLLEAAWQALEDAGIDPGSLRGEPVGVFAGISSQDYSGDPRAPGGELGGYRITGSFVSIASGRIAYSLGLEGPAMTVDTACSSSLVATHLAAQALRGGECSLALTGGATVISSPLTFTEFSRQRGLAPDGRCKSFAEAADGTGWSEGAGMLVLERLSDARENGHPVLATIRGSAVNQDGASNGLSAPNGPSQERVIRQALANARLQPAEVDAVEAHGTGTTLGDPIEAGALLATYGQERERPLKLGSLKSNIGHSQAAAGVGGVIKMVQAMREGLLPKTLHVDAPSSKVDWEAGEIELLTEPVEWKPNGHPRRAGISSFGISGTNAHLILEEPPAPMAIEAGKSRDRDGGPGGKETVESQAPLAGPIPLVLSAKSEPALRESAARLAARLEASPELDPVDVAYSLATTRSAFERRAVVLGRGREELSGALDALAAGRDAEGVARGFARGDGRPAFLFGGQGSQHPLMTVALLDSSPAYARHLEACERALSPFVDWSLAELLRDANGDWLDRLDVVQPALFAVMVSLARLWQDFGVRPAAVVGHSQGEIAAAHVAGGLSLSDAARVVAMRSKAMAKIAGLGGMVSVSLSAEQIAPRLEPFGERISLAAINGPASLVVSGDVDALTELLASCEQDGVRAQRIAVDYAAHSAQIEALEDELLEAFAPIEPRSGEIPFHSTVTGEQLDTAELGAEYWYRNLRRTVLLEPVLGSMLARGRRAFLEVSPHPVLGFGVQEAIDSDGAGEGAVALETLRRDDGGADRFARSLAEAHVAGISVDWEAYLSGSPARPVRLPTYPFQRKRYWLSAAAGARDAGAIGLSDLEHPLLGAAIESPEGEGLTLTGRISLATHAWLADHAVAGTVLFPGAGFLELALRAAAEVDAPSVEELTLEAPMILFEQGAVQLRVSVGKADERGRRELSIHSRAEGAGEPAEEREWTRHASGALGAEPVRAPDAIEAWPPAAAEPVDVSFLYDRLAEAGFEYGPAFQGFTASWRDGEQIYAEVSLDQEHAQGAQHFVIHPALLDAALHGIGLLPSREVVSAEQPQLPFSWSEVSVSAGGLAALKVRITPRGEEGVSLALADQEGRPVGQVGELALRPVDPGALGGATQRSERPFAIEWEELELGPPVGAPLELEAGDVELLRGAVTESDVPPLVLWEVGVGPAADRAEAARESTEAVLALIQEWLAADDLAATRLAVCTRGAVAGDDDELPDPAAAAVWGLLRSAQSEHPDRFVLLDWDASEASREAFGAALASGEPQIALREGAALVPRVVTARSRADWLIPPAGPWHLDAPRRGSLEGVALVPSSGARALGPTEVRVAVHAAGVNFRDVLVVLDFAVPGEGEIGSEGAGVVVEVGSEVDDLEPGDRVMGMLGGAFGPLAVSERRRLIPIPAGWSFEQAAAVPTVYLTARYGLFDLAGLQPGERVLIHAAAGGVGMTAVQLARHLGAEVFATASPGKWDVLREAGIAEDHIASSRDLDFKDRFLEVTDGEGVDVVLNSLAGEYVDASLELLPRGGRFMEMGRTDMRDPEQVEVEHRGVAYDAFDIVDIDLDHVARLLGLVEGDFERGALSHIPISGWDVRNAPAAFRHLREGRNIGKVVLEVPRPIEPGRTVLLTGGTGGLGATLARHLVAERGARRLLLVSRSGLAADGAAELKAELEGQGAEVEIAACDVSDRAQLEELLASIPEDRPLGAVIHAAGVLDDGTIESLGAEQIERVFAPKADAAWHLHELTADAGLSAFVLFSSAAGILGAPGQANYAAANAFLDALALRRRTSGLPSHSMAWGLWAEESGMTALMGDVDLARLRRLGIAPLSNEGGLALFDAALAADDALALTARFDSAALRAQASSGSLPALLGGLVRVPARRRQGATGSLAAKLAMLPEADRAPFVLELVRAEIATVLGHSSGDTVDTGAAFKELGFDSLAAVELRNRLREATGLQLPAAVVFNHPTAIRLAAFLRQEANGAAEQAPVAVPAALATEEPVAIVGMACRYPGGVGSPEQLWRLVATGGDAIAGFPTDRGWDLERLYHADPDQPGTSYSRVGGFLADAGTFDAEFFSIAPREALAMDPQQRLLLEASWEALEGAGLAPDSLHGTATGVFAGISSQDYAASRASEIELEGYLLTGSLTSVASGRIAYSLGLEGPAITVDTACSSSLVALHLAAQALRGGECSLALAGGATVISSPMTFTEFSRQRGLAVDGRCKSFAEGADGTGFAEGAGMLVLERLSDARENGHPVLATIRGSAVNQDGASNGLSAPNGPSQERVIRQALANARLQPAEVDAVEAHGTGTTLGDPIEAGALLATYGQERERPLKLGSIKSNIGHTQAAAGVAGVIKMVQAMREGLLPKTLHVDAPSSKVDWEAGEIELLTEPVEWKPNGHPRRAGVSSFGISGTNAHLILEEPPAPMAIEAGESRDRDGGPGGEETVESQAPLAGPIPLVLSAKSEPALRESAARLVAQLKDNPGLDPVDVAYSLTTTRSAFEHRAVALGTEPKELLAALQALASGADAPGLARGTARANQAPVFLFPGQGSQWQGMAAGLHGASAVFERALAECERALSPHLDFSVTDVVLGKEGAASIDRIEVVQPALFAVMVSLAALWRACGVAPAAVIGHSQGEIAAAHVSGGLSLEDAARLAALRSQLIARLAGQGAMVSVALPAGQLDLDRWGGRIELAAQNGPSSTILSAEREAVGELLAHCEQEGVRAKEIPATIPSHSARVEPLREELLAMLAPISPRSAEVPFYSTVTGALLDTKELGPEYWYRNLRQPVLFEQVTRKLAGQGHSAFIEVSPHPVFALAVGETLEDELPDSGSATVLGTLRRDQGGPDRFALSLAEAQAQGVAVDWSAFFEGSGARRVSLPTYPFQRERYWLNVSAGAEDLGAAGLEDLDHPLLAAAVEAPEGEGLTLTGRLSLQTHPWLADHAVIGTVLLPGTAFLELALAAGERAGAEAVEELTIEAPLVLPEQGAVALQLSITGPDEEGRREISIHSRGVGGEEAWTRNASGTLSAEPSPLPEPLHAWPPAGAEQLEVEDLYARFADIGLDYGPVFQGLTAAWRLGEEVYAEVSLAEEVSADAQRFAIHPALLDSALHAIGLTEAGMEELRLPFSWRGVSLGSTGASELRVKLVPRDGEGISLVIADQAGAPVAGVDSLALRAVDPSQLQKTEQGKDGLLGIEWKALEPLGEAVSFTEVELPSALAAQGELPELVLWRPGRDDPAADPAGAARQLTAAVLEQIQAWIAREELVATRLAILTEGAVAVEEGESPDLAQAAIWGLLRSAQSEHPGRFVLVDSDGVEASEGALGAALANEEDPQLALRNGVALAGRAAAVESHGDSLQPPRGPWRLETRKRGTLESLALVPHPGAEGPLGPTEVRIAMRAAGLNFRDVLIALGLYPGAASIGGEGAGLVVEVGPEVSDLTPGDAVMGHIAEAFGPLAVAERDFLARVPGGWSFEQAASVPTVFLTAHYGLLGLAGLKPGERVLIHAGAGGVGMAAIQLAQHLGAEVFATASSAKWDALREIGIAEGHIASSRDLSFKDKFLEATAGEGVDVVLNALAGEYVDASLELLPRGGRFLEMGKTDIREAAQVAADHPGVSYQAFDLRDAGSGSIGSMLGEVLALFESAALHHLPITSWDVRCAPEAFRHLREGNNVGKVVLSIPAPIEPEKTVLITGGTSGLGALVARHLVAEHGARHLLLVSRSGEGAAGADELKREIEERGAEATIAACDVSDRKQLAELLDSIPRERPLGAVIHSAGVLDDGTIESLGAEQLERVFAPKADAAWHLHELTADAGLSAFVLFSSAAGILGAPGQANYAAANAFLDGLADKRHHEGRPATSIAWGFWRHESVIASHLDEADLARIQRSGIDALSDEAGLALFDEALASAMPRLLALGLNRAELRSQAASGALPAILGGLVRAPSRRRSAVGSSFAPRLAKLSADEREALVLQLVRDQVATVLGHGSADQVAAGRAFKELGFDSLAAVELRNRLNAATGLRLPATVVFDHPNPAELASQILSSTGFGSSGEGQHQPGALASEFDRLESVLAGIESDDQREGAAARLRELLAGIDSGRGDDLAGASDEEMFDLLDQKLGRV